MARTRRIYQTDVLYVGPTGIGNPSTGKHYQAAVYGMSAGNPTGISGANLVTELFRVQSINDNWNKTLTDVNQFDELAAIDRIPLTQPTVSLTFEYLLANFINERNIGLTVAQAGDASLQSCILTILSGSQYDNNNYFIRTVSEGADAVGVTSTTNNVKAIGNGFIDSYSSTAAVGGFPSASVTIQGLNIEVESVSSGANIPAVNPTDGTAITGWYYQLPTATQNVGGGTINAANNTLSVLRPGDITLSLGLGAGDGFYQESDLKVQNYTLSLNMNRQDLNKLGSKYAFAKVIQFPLTATLNVTADIGELQTGSLIEIVNNNTTFNPTITINKPGTTTPIVFYRLGGAKLDSQDFSSSIGPNSSVTMAFSTQIGGPSSTNGLQLSGICS